MRAALLERFVNHVLNHALNHQTQPTPQGPTIAASAVAGEVIRDFRPTNFSEPKGGSNGRMYTAGIIRCGWLFHYVWDPSGEIILNVDCMEDDPCDAASPEWARNVIAGVQDSVKLTVNLG